MGNVLPWGMLEHPLIFSSSCLLFLPELAGHGGAMAADFSLFSFAAPLCYLLCPAVASQPWHASLQSPEHTVLCLCLFQLCPASTTPGAASGIASWPLAWNGSDCCHLLWGDVTFEEALWVGSDALRGMACPADAPACLLASNPWTPLGALAAPGLSIPIAANAAE